MSKKQSEKQTKTQKAGPMTTEAETPTATDDLPFLATDALPPQTTTGSAQLAPKPMTAEEIKAKEEELGLPANATIDMPEPDVNDIAVDVPDDADVPNIPPQQTREEALPPQSPLQPATEFAAVKELEGIEPLVEIKSQTQELSRKRDQLQNELMNELPLRTNGLNDKLHLYDLQIQQREAYLRGTGLIVSKGGYPGNNPAEDIKNPGGKNKPTEEYPEGRMRDATMDKLRYNYWKLTQDLKKVHEEGRAKAEQLQHIQSLFVKETGTRKGNI